MRYTGESSWSRMRLLSKKNNLQSAAHEASFVYTLPSARVHANFFSLVYIFILFCVPSFVFLFVYQLNDKYKLICQQLILFLGNLKGGKKEYQRTMCGSSVDDGLKNKQHELILFNVTYENFKISYSFMVIQVLHRVFNW